MPRIDVVVECPIHDSFRVQQVAGMFDVSLEQKARQAFSVEVPGPDEDWIIGAIVGPSGSGKTTIARQAFGDCLFESAAAWPKNKAVVDCFGKLSAKEITYALTLVGFSSPPSWCKPYHVLSNGERFRCDLARALVAEKPIVAYDEFTSVVDRTVGKVGSAAVSKAIRGGRIKRRFVAITCHYDVVEWLEPDWVLDMSTQELARGSLRRPQIKVAIFRCEHRAWRLFARHHYLSAELNRSAKCYVGLLDGQPATFAAILPCMGFAGRDRISRVVVLPDFQGIGLGGSMCDAMGELSASAGRRLSIVAAHPSICWSLQNRKTWKVFAVRACTTSKVGRGGKQTRNSVGRAVISFEYVGSKRD